MMWGKKAPEKSKNAILILLLWVGVRPVVLVYDSIVLAFNRSPLRAHSSLEMTLAGCSDRGLALLTLMGPGPLLGILGPLRWN